MTRTRTRPNPTRKTRGFTRTRAQHYEELKKLGSWSEFASKVRLNFVCPNWKMDQLAEFYAVRQGPGSFEDFADRLQDARNGLASAGLGFTINDSVYKNHLLFFCHPVLSLRVRNQKDIDYAATRVDALVANMAATWSSLVAEGLIRPARAPAPTPSTSTTPSIASTNT